ncbi:MAG TPA: hypothetical protein PLZ62_02885 [bacterium]|nr:hypothetical protein [bacterium]
MQKVWDAKLSIRHLPDNIKQYFLFEARCLLAEITNDCYDPEQIPVSDPSFVGQKKRTKSGRPDWYKEIKSDYHHFRRYRLKKSINRIIFCRDGRFGVRRYKYDYLVRSLIKLRLIEGYYYIKFVAPNNEFRLFLGYEPEYNVDLPETNNNEIIYDKIIESNVEDEEIIDFPYY